MFFIAFTLSLSHAPLSFLPPILLLLLLLLLRPLSLSPLLQRDSCRNFNAALLLPPRALLTTTALFQLLLQTFLSARPRRVRALRARSQSCSRRRARGSPNLLSLARAGSIRGRFARQTARSKARATARRTVRMNPRAPRTSGHRGEHNEQRRRHGRPDLRDIPPAPHLAKCGKLVPRERGKSDSKSEIRRLSRFSKSPMLLFFPSSCEVKKKAGAMDGPFIKVRAPPRSARRERGPDSAVARAAGRRTCWKNPRRFWTAGCERSRRK